MTVRESHGARQIVQSVQAVRRSLARTLFTRHALLAIAAVLGLAVIIDAALLLSGANRPSGGVFTAMIVFASILASLMVWMWSRQVAPPLDDVRAALWIEERNHEHSADANENTTQSSFALVTLVEAAQQDSSSTISATLQAAAQRVLTSTPVADALRASSKRQLAGPALFSIGAIMVLMIGRMWAFGDRLSVGVSESGVASPSASPKVDAPLGAWTVRVVPPAYTRQAATTLGDVASVTAISGSVLVVQGRGNVPTRVIERLLGEAADTMSAARREREIVPTDVGAEWQVRTVARDVPATMQLTRGGSTKQLVIEGRTDSIPAVTLLQPARDSVFRTADVSVPLMAQARDDIGLAQARFELIISSGEGERFTARTVALAARSFSGDKSATLRASLDFGALKLVAGDIVHVRAIARDAHPSTSREFGSSETRSFRIARAAEYDSVAVEPAPPPEVDKSLMSQRMLLMLTEKLEKQRPKLQRPQLLSESMKLARDQGRLRQAVGDVVFQRLSGDVSGEHVHTAGDGHDHGVEQQQGKLALTGSNAGGVLAEGDDSPIIAINQPLLEAYNAMWDAGRELEQGAPKAAIPHMRLALAAIERARSAERLYLRGKPPTVIVDIAKVRLAGKDTGATNTRGRRETIPPREAMRTARLIAAAQLTATSVSAARDSLAVLRVEALADAPAFAASVARVLDALENGGDVTEAFLVARRVLGGVVRTDAGAWSREVPR